MITAKKVKAALRHNVDISALTRNGWVAAAPKPNKLAKRGRKSGGPSGLMPPHPKTKRPHLVEKSFAWEDLQKVLRQNSAHGIPRVQEESKVQAVSGLDLRRRIHALGFTVTQFARRHGMAASMFYDMTHFPAGMLLTRHIRIVEYEELLASIADILEDEKLTAEEIRGRLDTLLSEAAERL